MGVNVALHFSLLSGLLLQVLLLVGMDSTLSSGYLLVWCLHLLVHLCALVVALVSLLKVLANSSSLSPGRGKLIIAAAFTAIASLLLIILWASVPVTARDALIYHLAVPKLWLKAGRIVEIPWHEWSYFPLLPALGYSGFLRLGFEQLTAFYHLSYLILLISVVAVKVGQFLGPVSNSNQAAQVSDSPNSVSLSAVLVALVFLSTLPLCLRLASEPMADLPAALYFAAAFFGLLELGGRATARNKIAADNALLRENTQRWNFALAGIAAGLAISCKYSSLLGISLLGLTIPFYLNYCGVEKRRILSGVVSFGLLIILVSSPWMIKNAIWTGNPCYPFLGSLFGSANSTPFVGETSALQYRIEAFSESLLDLILIPLRMVFSGEDDNPRYFAGVLNPLVLLALVPLVGILSPESRRQRAWILFTSGLWLGYLILSLVLFHALVRYQLLLAAPVALLVAYGLEQIRSAVAAVLKSRPPGAKYLSALPELVFIGLAVIFAGIYWQKTEQKIGSLNYLFSEQTKEEYLARHVSEYQLASIVNTRLPESAVVYLLYTGNRYYFYDRQVRGEYFSGKEIIEFLQNSEYVDLTISELSALLQRRILSQGITHLAIHNRRIREVFSVSLTNRELSAWREFSSNYLELSEQGKFASIWRLRKY